MGQTGDGTTTTPRPAAVRALLSDATAIVVTGAWHNCALSAAGTLSCWGYNPYGQLGDGTTASPKPIAVSVAALGSEVADAALGGYHSCALKKDSTLWCWGQNTFGTLGDGSVGPAKRTPVQVVALGANVARVAAGPYSTCAVRTDRAVWCWGRNDSGQLGDGTMEGQPCDTGNPQPSVCRASPVRVKLDCP
jgi:alpha-tubulin suppressor-like RCC1 family protein